MDSVVSAASFSLFKLRCVRREPALPLGFEMARGLCPALNLLSLDPAGPALHLLFPLKLYWAASWPSAWSAVLMTLRLLVDSHVGQ